MTIKKEMTKMKQVLQAEKIEQKKRQGKNELMEGLRAEYNLLLKTEKKLNIEMASLIAKAKINA